MNYFLHRIFLYIELLVSTLVLDFSNNKVNLGKINVAMVMETFNSGILCQVSNTGCQGPYLAHIGPLRAVLPQNST
jgi:hypothetical protein